MGRKEIGSKKLNAKFFIRVLPTLDFSTDNIKIDAKAKVMYVKCLQNMKKVIKDSNDTFWSFSADEIFYNASQEKIFSSVCEDFVGNAVDGVSGLIFAYGQSGSGKTFTVSGLRHHYQNRGLILRLLSLLCDEREANRDLKRISIGMSYLEFSGSKIMDLLSNAPVGNFKDVKKMKVKDEMDAWKSIFDAEVQKSLNLDAPYESSHRGHTVLTFHVESMSLIESNPLTTCSKVHIVDTSGIDTIGGAQSVWRSRSDLGYSNLTKSLMEQLILCITGKTWKMRGCVCPYKSTKLLHYLQDALHPYCMIRFIGHIIGNADNLPLTLSVLRFGEKLRGFKPSRLEGELPGNHTSLNMKALEIEVSRLRAELDLSRMLSNSPNYSNLSEEMVQEIRRAANNFLTGKIENLTFLSLGQAEISLEAMKGLYYKATQEKDRAIREAIEEYETQTGLERPTPDAPNPPSVARASRRRISRNDLGTGVLRSSDTNVGSALKASNLVTQVGHLDKKGIGMGLGKTVPNFEGLVTRALKKVRSRKSDNVIRPAPNSSSLKDRKLPSSKDFSIGDTQATATLPTKEEAWLEFTNERSDFVLGYQENISKLEENLVVSRKNYATALCEMAKIREAFEKLKRAQEEWKHVSRVGADPEKDEDPYASSLEKKETEWNNAVELCHTTWIDLRDGTEEVTEAKAALENEFQAFCEDKYKIDIMMADECLPETRSKSSPENMSKTEIANQIRMGVYFQLQKKMMSYVSGSKKSPAYRFNNKPGALEQYLHIRSIYIHTYIYLVYPGLLARMSFSFTDSLLLPVLYPVLFFLFQVTKKQKGGLGFALLVFRMVRPQRRSRMSHMLGV